MMMDLISTLSIADYTGKRHKQVCVDVSKRIGLNNVIQTYYFSERNKFYPVYLLTTRQFGELMMSYVSQMSKKSGGNILDIQKGLILKYGEELHKQKKGAKNGK